MFLFREAADCLWQSYEMVRSNAVYRSYLAILPLYLSEEDYKKRLEELKVPKEQLDKIEEEKQEVLAKAEKNAEDRKRRSGNTGKVFTGRKKKIS